MKQDTCITAHGENKTENKVVYVSHIAYKLSRAVLLNAFDL